MDKPCCLRTARIRTNGCVVATGCDSVCTGHSMKRAVLYLRVSTLDQTTANQERELREIAGRPWAQLMICRPF